MNKPEPSPTNLSKPEISEIKLSNPETLTANPPAENPPVKAVSLKKPHISGIFSSVSNQDKINFARHLSMVAKAGMPVQEGLRIIRAQTESKVLRKIIDQLIADLNNGHFLADSLGQYENLFGNFFINIIRVGETSGTLSKNLLYLAEELRKSKALSSKIKSAMIYPAVILFATLGMIVFLTFFIFPKLLPLFQGFGTKLPATTTALIAVMNFIKNYGIYMLGASVVLYIGLKIAKSKINAFHYFLNSLIFRIPVISSLSISINMVNLSRVLALLLKSGMRIVDAVDVTSKTFENLVYQRAVREANEEIKKGGQIATYLAKRPNLFPPLFFGMVKMGETTGTLEENLEYLAEYYEDETNNKLSSLTSLLEPLLLLLMGGMVGFVALSIITPIYSISQGIK
ncbi:MAG: type II secretion system F family protein [Candidatus Liptonbacteria bacterium]|nr:type II secretion system F family protein [Candidatus Liptonbacteria bacterium]